MKKWYLEEKEGYTLVHNQGGATLGFQKDSGVTILEVDGYAFKDLNRNGVLDPYEDWRLPVEERVRDLVSRMDLDSKLGLSLHDGMFMVMRLTQQALDANPSLKARVALMGKTPEELAVLDPTEPTDYHRELITHDEMRCWLMSAIDGPEYAARYNNNIQKIAEGHKFGIPVYFSTNPRAFQDTHSDTTENDVSCWPSNLGLGATFDPSVAKQMAETISREYRAMGITMELGPQVDLASDPRWDRMSATYGSDERLNADMARAVCDGLQTSQGDAEIEAGWGRDSVLAMCKHWPGSTGEGGRESHKESGKYTVYPGGNFDKHIYPWTEGAFRLEGPTAQCGAVMSCYDDIWEIGGDDAELSGASFNQYIVDTLLRKEHGFQGFVCTDFWITGSLKKERTTRPQVNAWGYTDVTPAERALKEWECGVDQCGGTNEIEIMQQAYWLAQKKHGPGWASRKVDAIASRVLTYGFRVGSFENPYADPSFAQSFVGSREFRERGMEAHRKSIILVKNSGVLPLSDGMKMWIADKYHGGIPDRAGNVDPITKSKPVSDAECAGLVHTARTPEEADCALVFMETPASGFGFDTESGEYRPISLQYRPYTAVNARKESIAGDYVDGVKENRSYRDKTVETYNAYDLDNLLEVRAQMGEKPVILVLNCKNPIVPAEFEPYVDAVLIAFAGTPNRVLLEALAGRYEPSGLLPFQMPESMDTIETHFEDTPRDLTPYADAAGHAWDFGFGMNWSGVISDARVERYR
ncbi:MAG: glycoside hydrolase family 3 C-terminal domain-containing protein [Clostridiales bacterium]|nr:glycoside hydrolase family 3 C-terminal domain-containing protein [Clostridiales bacterium]